MIHYTETPASALVQREFLNVNDLLGAIVDYLAMDGTSAEDAVKITSFGTDITVKPMGFTYTKDLNADATMLTIEIRREDAYDLADTPRDFVMSVDDLAFTVDI